MLSRIEPYIYAIFRFIVGFLFFFHGLQKIFGMNIYEGAGHAFHNDTGAAYNGFAADDAWTKTLLWFDKFLRA